MNLFELKLRINSWKRLESFTRKVYEISVNGKNENYVLKCYDFISKFLVLFENLSFNIIFKAFGRQAENFSIKKRLENEIRSEKLLENLGIKTPRVVCFDPTMLIEEKIEGKPLGNAYDEGTKFGEMLTLLHSNDLVNYDPRISNFILGNDGIYVVDREMLKLNANLYEKLAELMIILTDPNTSKEFKEGFKEGYKEKKLIECLSKANSLKFLCSLGHGIVLFFQKLNKLLRGLAEKF